MVRVSLHVSVRTWTAIAIALAASVWCAPSRALASCGDYITMTRDHGPFQAPAAPQFVQNDSSRLETEFVRDVLGRLAQHVPAPSLPCQKCPVAPGQAPCQGPWCSGNHVPIPAPPTTVGPLQDAWACGFDVLAARTPVGVSLLAEQRGRVHHVFPVFHPPRTI
jgi:hypothetical protein